MSSLDALPEAGSQQVQVIDRREDQREPECSVDDLGASPHPELELRMRNVLLKARLAMRVSKGAATVNEMRQFGDVHKYRGNYDAEGAQYLRGLAANAHEDPTSYVSGQFYRGDVGPVGLVETKGADSAPEQAAIQSLSECLVDDSDLEIDDEAVRRIASKYVRARLGQL